MNKVEAWVNANPKIGFTVREVADALSMPYSTAKMHLKRMRDAGKIRIWKWKKPLHGSMAYTMVLRLGKGVDAERPEMLDLRKEILKYVEPLDRVTARAVADQFNIFTSAAHYHLEKLVEVNKVCRLGNSLRPNGSGREMQYAPMKKVRAAQRKAEKESPVPKSAWGIAMKGIL